MIVKPYDPSMFIRKGTGVAPSRTLIYTDQSGDLSEDMFTSWPLLYARYQQIEGPVNIVIYPTSSNLAVPSGTYQFKLGDTIGGSSLGLPIQLFFEDGAVFYDMYTFTNNINIVGQSSTGPCLFFQQSADLLGFSVVIFYGGSGLVNLGSFPMIQWGLDLSTKGPIIFNLALAAQLPTSAVPLIDITPSGPFASLAIFQFFLGTNLGRDTISGSGNAIAQWWISDPGILASTDQPQWLGLSSLTSPDFRLSKINTYTRFSDQNTIVVSGDYDAGVYATSGFPGAEYVRCRPDGSLTPINIVLPDVAYYVGESFTIKRDNSDTATTITATAQVGQLIDGAAFDTVPGTSYAYRRYISDGEHWMREGSGI